MMSMQKKIILISLTILSILLTGCDEDPLQTYLDKNRVLLNLQTEDAIDLGILDGDAKKYKIFLTGENHGVQANTKLKMKFLKYFKEKADIKYLVEERSWSSAYFLNQYLISGDEEILRAIFKDMEQSYMNSKEEYEFYQKLYE